MSFNQSSVEHGCFLQIPICYNWIVVIHIFCSQTRAKDVSVFENHISSISYALCNRFSSRAFFVCSCIHPSFTSDHCLCPCCHHCASLYDGSSHSMKSAWFQLDIALHVLPKHLTFFSCSQSHSNVF